MLSSIVFESTNGGIKCTLLDAKFTYCFYVLPSFFQWWLLQDLVGQARKS